MKIGFIALAMLFVCSLLSGALLYIPFDELLGLDDSDPAENIPDPNADIIATQRALVAENPDSVDANLLMANILGNSGKLNEAIPYYEKAVDLAPEDASVRYDFARALADGDYRADAELQFQQVIELDPDHQNAMYYLAELYMAWDPTRAEEAEALYERAIELDPKSSTAENAQNRLNSIAATPAGSASPAATPDGAGTGG